MKRSTGFDSRGEGGLVLPYREMTFAVGPTGKSPSAKRRTRAALYPSPQGYPRAPRCGASWRMKKLHSPALARRLTPIWPRLGHRSTTNLVFVSLRTPHFPSNSPETHSTAEDSAPKDSRQEDGWLRGQIGAEVPNFSPRRPWLWPRPDASGRVKMRPRPQEAPAPRATTFTASLPLWRQWLAPAGL